MTTRCRFVTILFSLVILGSFGWADLVFVLKTLQEGSATGIAMFIIAWFSLLVLGGLGSIIWLTLTIEVDMRSRIITFTYPLRFSEFKYEFKDIIGFRFSYLSGKVNYKSLRFRTNDGRTFGISDFETTNLRELESIALSAFDLRADKDFRKLTEDEKKSELAWSAWFDLSQAKDIRMYLGISALGLLVMAAMTIYNSKAGGSDVSMRALIAATCFLLAAYFCGRRFLRVHMQIKNSKVRE